MFRNIRRGNHERYERGHLIDFISTRARELGIPFSSLQSKKIAPLAAPG
jgi:hypothetical protein